MIHEEPNENGQFHISPFWPLVLVSAAFVILEAYQFTLIFTQRMGLQRQIQQQSEVVTRANQTQNELQRVVMELLALADTGNADAKAIVAKYKISNSAPAAPVK
ncbi:MAG: hypothetical protein B9S32_14385 [Verrucomicrobia bacterium Tous-C9LFEB]|nr:MAG: hypothetical protein B9S32_14385 [Verrucomicrobia bacterium Tous-C9LFEB]